MAYTGLDLLSASLRAVGAVLFAVVAWYLLRRAVRPESKGAQRGFALWWAGLSLLGLIGLVTDPDLTGIDIEAAGMGAWYVYAGFLILLLAAMVGGLTYYLAYLYTGRRSTLWIIVVYWAAWSVLTAAFVLVQDPFTQFDAEAGEYEIDYHEELPQKHWLGLAFAFGLVVPPLVAVVMYLLLLLRVRDRTGRYRIAAIGLGILLWFGFATTNAAIGVGEDTESEDGGREVRSVVSQVFGLVAALLVLAAYFPPRIIRRAWGVRSLADDSAAGPPPDAGAPGGRTPPFK